MNYIKLYHFYASSLVSCVAFLPSFSCLPDSMSFFTPQRRPRMWQPNFNQGLRHDTPQYGSPRAPFQNQMIHGNRQHFSPHNRGMNTSYSPRQNYHHGNFHQGNTGNFHQGRGNYSQGSSGGFQHKNSGSFHHKNARNIQLEGDYPSQRK